MKRKMQAPGSISVLLFVSFILTHLSTTLSINKFVNFSKCSSKFLTVSGASLLSQNTHHYSNSNTSCHVTFQTPQPSMQFLVQIFLLDTRKQDTCVDELQITYGYNVNKSTVRFCGSLSRVPQAFYTFSNYTEIRWNVGSNAKGYRGFHLVLTSVSQSPQTCIPTNNGKCVNGDCISSSLICDGVTHCLDGSDELNCPGPLTAVSPMVDSVRSRPIQHSHNFRHHSSWHDSPPQHRGAPHGKQSNLHSTAKPYLPRTTKYQVSNSKGEVSPGKSNPRGLPTHPVAPGVGIGRRGRGFNSGVVNPNQSAAELNGAFVWLPILVVGVFSLVMVSLMFITRRIGQRDSGYTTRLADSPVNVEQTLSADLNANIDASGNGIRPSTPPPSYSIIERQISYVSNISLDSDMLCYPPGYDEALNMPGTVNRIRPHRRLSSNNSLLRQNNRTKLYSRSISETTNPVHSSNLRNDSNGNRDVDNVFYDSSHTDTIHEERDVARSTDETVHLHTDASGEYRQQDSEGIEDMNAGLLPSPNVNLSRSLSDSGPVISHA